MTKPKIANGNCQDPLARLQRKMEEYKRRHNDATKNCNKIQDAHNRSSAAIKAHLERKSKASEGKTKKKRSAATASTISRKKSKIVENPKEVTSAPYENGIDSTPNVTLNVHSSDIPDIDWDNFDILKDPAFMSMNEQEIEGVLSSCYVQSTSSNNNEINSEMFATYKSQPNMVSDITKPLGSINNLKKEEVVSAPLFPPPPENNTSSLLRRQTDFMPNGHYKQVQQQPVSSGDMDSLKFSMPYTPDMRQVGSTMQDSAFGYHYSDNSSTAQLQPDAMNKTYFYAYPHAFNVPDTYTEPSASSFQLPAMSSGWYNTAPSQLIKQPTAKVTQQTAQQQQPSQQQQFVSPTTTMPQYSTSYVHYLPEGQATNTQVPCQQLFSMPQDSRMYGAGPQQYTIGGYSMVQAHNPQQQQQQQIPYYYITYNTTNQPQNFTDSVAMISQNDTRYLASHNSSVNCRNFYPSHCI